VKEYLDKTIEPGWAGKVMALKDMLLRGKEVRDQINILGDDSVPLEYHIIFNKAEVVDFVILQQDAFDDIDGCTPLVRQKYLLNKVTDICEAKYSFDGFEEISSYFRRVINLIRDMNRTVYESDKFYEYERQINSLLAERISKPLTKSAQA